jgi:predicted transport protein
MANIDDKLASKPWLAKEFRPTRTDIQSFIKKRKIPISKKTITRVRRRLQKRKWLQSLPLGKDVAITESDSPQLITYGTARLGGVITFFAVNNNNRDSHYLISFNCHEINDITKLFLDNEQVVFASGSAGQSASNSFGGKVFLSKNLGSDSQSADSNLVANVPAKWTSNHRQRGISNAYIKLEWDKKIWEEIPDFTVEIQGKKVYDPRTETTIFTDNAALVIADYLTNTKFGYGLSLDKLDLSTDEGGLQWAADICDESVSLASGGTEKRYAVNGWFPTGRSHREVLDELVACMGGFLTFVGGKWKFWPAKYITPTLTLTESDLRSPLKIKTINSRRDIFNTVKGTFVDKNNGYEVTNYPQVTNSLYKSQDQNEVIAEELNYQFVTSSAQAQRLSKMELEAIRQGINVQAMWSLKAYQLETPNNVKITIDRLGWTEKVFQVLEVEKNEEYSGSPVHEIYLNLQETASGVYDWNSGNETIVDLSPNTDLPNPFDVETPVNLVLESGTEHLDKRSDGTIFSRLYVAWDALTDYFISGGGRIEIQYKKASDGSYINAPSALGDSTFAYILDVLDTTTYNVRIRAVNALEVASDWLTGSHLVVGKTEKPSDVSGIAVSLNNFGILVSWNKVSDIDVKKYILKFSDGDDSWEESQLLDTTDATTYQLPIKTIGSYKFQVKALDTSGNESLTANVTSVTISNPAAPTNLTATLGGENLTIKWDAVPRTELFAISDYVISYGNDFVTSLVIATSKTLHLALKVQWGGLRRFWILARDVAGNIGSPSSIDVDITIPTSVQSLNNDVIDNNVLLKWEEPASHSLPIDYYSVYKGDTFETAVQIGNLKGTFAAYFEIISGSYTYWVVPVDTAGNVGGSQGTLAVVSQPPDFEVQDDAIYLPEDFDSLINVVIENESMLAPAYPTSLDSKFLSNDWETLQDQIDAGYPIMIEPSAPYAVIEKIIDYGTTFPGTLVRASWLKEVLDDDINVVCTLGYSSDGITFDDTYDVTQIYAVDFRYVKIRLEIGTIPVTGVPMGLLLAITNA